MLFLLVGRLLGLAVSLVLISAVCDHLGPGVAARSMTGVMQEVDAAQHGDTARARSISHDLVGQRTALQAQVADVLHRAEVEVEKLAPSH